MGLEADLRSPGVGVGGRGSPQHGLGSFGVMLFVFILEVLLPMDGTGWDGMGRDWGGVV